MYTPSKITKKNTRKYMENVGLIFCKASILANNGLQTYGYTCNKLLYVLELRLAHSSLSHFHSSDIHEVRLSCTRRSHSSHKFSIGFKSGDWAGGAILCGTWYSSHLNINAIYASDHYLAKIWSVVLDPFSQHFVKDFPDKFSDILFHLRYL